MHKLSKDSEKDGNTPLSSTVWNIRPPVTWIWANWEKVKDREAWCATVYRVAKSWTWLSDWTPIASDMNGNPGQPGILLHATKIKVVPTQNQFIHRILDIFSPPRFQELFPEALGIVRMQEWFTNTYFICELPEEEIWIGSYPRLSELSSDHKEKSWASYSSQWCRWVKRGLLAAVFMVSFVSWNT